MVPRGLSHLEDDGHLRVETLLPRCRKVGPSVENEPVDGGLQARRGQSAAPAVVVGDALADRLPPSLGPAVQRKSHVRCRAPASGVEHVGRQSHSASNLSSRSSSTGALFNSFVALITRLRPCATSTRSTVSRITVPLCGLT